MRRTAHSWIGHSQTLTSVHFRVLQPVTRPGASNLGACGQTPESQPGYGPKRKPCRVRFAKSNPVLLNPELAEKLVKALESAQEVRRRHHFFIWLQGPFKALVPHSLSVCGAYQRQARDLVFEAFNNELLPAATLGALTDPAAPTTTALARLWVDRGGRPLAVALADLPYLPPAADQHRLMAAGLTHWLVHGVARPFRPSDIESLFLLAEKPTDSLSERLTMLELLMPHLHAVYQRVQVLERELGGISSASAVSSTAAGPSAQARKLGRSQRITERERQVLSLMREGQSNQQIAEHLALSALTVKNHVQSILFKLGASNRAQAVALAMSSQLLDL